MILLWPTAMGAVHTVGTDGATVQDTIDGAAPGDVVLVPEGVWSGPVVVDRAIRLEGTGGIIDGDNTGTVIRVTAPEATVVGLRVRRSGRDLAETDACIYVDATATGAVVSDNEVWQCTFGIWVHTTRGATISGNVVRGRDDVSHRSDMGNGIHLFDGSELEVLGNQVRGTRDGIYVSATENSLIADNQITGVRYGIHYMYSYDNTVRNNRCSENTAGMALMGSHRLQILDNVSTGNTAHGILVRDIQFTRIAGNRVEENGEGFFFFSSLDNQIENNFIAHNEIGARVWAGTERNTVVGNAFVANRQQVYYVSAYDQVWGTETDGNYWSDYVGWDQDGDALGDRPYEVATFMANLLYQYPQAAMLMYSPTLELLDVMQSRLPALKVPTIIDPHPRVSWSAP